MGRTRSSLTPMIGLSLAALVAGSLVTLAVLAQRVSLDVPIATPVLPRPPGTAASAPPLVVDDPPPTLAEGLDRAQRRDLDLPPDRVLPLRVSRAATPAPGHGRPHKANRRQDRKGGGKGGGKEPREAAIAHLPPGIVKKVNRGGEMPPGHRKNAPATGAQSHPSHRSQGRGRGVCGEPPCGKD